ncbi:MAG: metallophosphoesterase [Gallionella sp.]|nr:metallophosphoesterase [Gallionella sp.]
MKIQILSDLHVEYAPYTPEPTDAEVIVLAGDISQGIRGIKWARQTWPDKAIVFVPGNHEYYRSDIETERQQMAMAGRAYNVHVLNRQEAIICGVRFLGATLWTDFRLFGEAERPLALQVGGCGLRDFQVIRYGNQIFTPQDSVELHIQDVAWLTHKLQHEPFEGATVVVTHHLPSAQSVAARYSKQLLSACFASPLDYLLGYSRLWIHGHTHDTFDYEVNGTRVICNPRGYCDGNLTPENLAFDPQCVLTL